MSSDGRATRRGNREGDQRQARTPGAPDMATGERQLPLPATREGVEPTEVEKWFDGQPPQRQREWLDILPPKFRIPERLAFTVPAQYREAWLMVTYLGFGDTAVSWFPAGPLAQLLIARRARS